MVEKIITYDVTQEQVDQVFQEVETHKEPHQYECLIGLYKLAGLQEFDRVEKLLWWPACNETTWKYICKKFIGFDAKYHKNVVHGGLWMNAGFTMDKSLVDWEFAPIPADKIVWKTIEDSHEKA